MSAAKSRPRDIRRGRRQHRHSCWEHLVVAPLWLDEELGTRLFERKAGITVLANDGIDRRRRTTVRWPGRSARRTPTASWVATGRYSIDENGDTTLSTYGGYRVRGTQLVFDHVIEASG